MFARTDPFPYFWACSALGLLCGVVKLLRFGRREKHLPPGPPTWPILGNAHLTVDPKLFKKQLFLLCELLQTITTNWRVARFKQWSVQYGDVFSLKVGKGTMIVLNSKRSVYELIDQRSALYSSRPIDDRSHLTMKENVAFMDPTPVWRLQRKIVVRYLAPEKLDGDLEKVSNAE
ncbi:hypothetical protein SLS60_011803 [Paraconiothyrium brasiliense]|uniref:Cytochrome P450 n=1 Tax=Paraconiothyrium brasiliense TaxID=300254 RepID=A0ABR3QHC5_9PLEO